MHQVVKNVIAIRKSKKLSQEDVANKLDMYQSKYARFEGAATKIDFQLLERVAKEVFEMEVEEVLNYHKDHETDNYAIEDNADIVQEKKPKYVTFSTLDLILKSKDETIQALKKALMDKEELIKILKSKLS